MDFERPFMCMSCAPALCPTLFALSRCRISKAKGSGDLLSRTQMHVGGQDEESYDGGTVVSRGKNLTCVGMRLTLAPYIGLSL
jgi:hypothetical protein